MFDQYCSVKTSSRYWPKLYQTINGIQWDDLINLHNHEYAMKSMSIEQGNFGNN